MEITLLDPESKVIAEDDSDGIFEFDEGSSVVYKHHSDQKVWYVNHNYNHFKESVDAFNSYNDAIDANQSEEKQLALVAQLKSRLIKIEDFQSLNNSYWESILQQCEWGQL
ncbi:hypothetical protein ACJJIL_23475 (plasmid) [Microbulbifer sp. EKSA005]|uniref:hypothetical protein n=1 Tax=Microbulbifer sp. EKSA005 TaxID=3243364 RepID=UPI0040434F16